MCGGIAPIGGVHGHSLRLLAGERHRVWHLHVPAGMQPRLPPRAAERRHVQRLLRHHAVRMPVTISRNLITSGDRVPGVDRRRGAGGQRRGSGAGRAGRHRPELQRDLLPAAGGIGFPDRRDAACRSRWPPHMCRQIQFVDVDGFWFNASIPPFLITNGRARALLARDGAAGSGAVGADPDARRLPDHRHQPGDRRRQHVRADRHQRLSRARAGRRSR